MLETIRVKVTIADLPPEVAVSYASAVHTGKTVEGTISKLRKQAQRRGINATYELATEEQYWAFRNQRAAELVE